MAADRKSHPSYVWEPMPGDAVAECPDCGPFWEAAFEATEDGLLVLREWHRSTCPVWEGDPPK